MVRIFEYIFQVFYVAHWNEYDASYLHEILHSSFPLTMPRTVSLLRRFVLLFLLCCGVKFNALAQDSAASPVFYRVVLTDAKIALQDGLSFWSSPVRFSGRDWMIAGGAAAGTLGVISADNYLYRTFSIETDDQLPHSAWEIPTYYGEMEYASIFSAGLYAAGLVSGEKNIRVTGRLVLESLALSGTVMVALRYMTARSGPAGDAWDFKGFQWSNEGQSFPSGHSVVAFAMSTVLAEQIDHPFARIGLYGFASLTAYSRVRFTQHWTSDVLVGSALGIASGLYVVSREREREGQNGECEGLSIMPTANGLCVRYTF